MSSTACAEGIAGKARSWFMLEGVMKKFFVVLLVFLGLQSVATAQGGYFGVKLGLPYLFTVQYGYDFQAVNQGFGIRGFLGSSFLGTGGVVGLGLDAYGRAPIGDYGSSAYAGLTGSVALSFGNAVPVGSPPPSGGSSANITGLLGVLLGLEFVLGQNWSLFLEMQPMTLVVSSFSTQFFTLPLVSIGVNVKF
jgi:hypothetical protein